MPDTTDPTVTDTVPPTEAKTEAEDVKLDVDVTDLGGADPEDAAAEATPADEDAAEDAEATDDAAEAAAAGETPAPKPTAPKEDPDLAAQKEAKDKRSARLVEINNELKALDAKSDDDYDPVTDARKHTRLLAEKDRLRDQIQEELQAKIDRTEAASDYERGWAKWERENPDLGKKGRTIYEEELEKAEMEFGLASEGAFAVAKVKWKERTNLIRAQRRAKDPKKDEPAAAPAKPKPPVNKGGARIVPAGISTKPSTQPKTPEEQLIADVGGKIGSFLT